jgi:alkaline phosphatase D
LPSKAYLQGYLDEREKILRLLWAQGGGVVISGDRHEHGESPLGWTRLISATTLLPPPANSDFDSSSAVIEFSTSPLSFFHQPWKREYEPHWPTDIPIHVQWKGMSRFGRFDFDTTNGLAVDYTLVVDGIEAWKYQWRKGMVVNTTSA